MDSARDILVRSSSDESFEHIDPDFDNTYYPDLHGVATADYIPMEKDEVLLKKGDKLVITEQSLDQNDFYIINSKTGAQGRVPTEFVKIVTEETSMEDTGEIVHILHSDLHHPLMDSEEEIGSDLDRGRRHGKPRRHGKGVVVDNEEEQDSSDLDNGVRHERMESDLDMGASGRVVPGKKSGKMGIMRRKGVSKSKGSPYRSSGSSHEDDTNPLIINYQKRADDHRGNDLSHQATPHSTSSSNHNSSSSQTFPRSSQRSPPEDERAQSVAVLPEFGPEYKLVAKYNILSVSGADRDGRPVIVLSACRLPPTYLINHQRLLEYCMKTLDQYVEQDYTIVYFHHGFNSANKPSFTWIREVYSALDRKYKKNLKKLYIVHPTNLIRVMMILLKPIISYKFGRKLSYINRLDELRPVMFLEQIDIPQQVKDYDARLMSSVRSVTQTDSRSQFHVPNSAAYTYSLTDSTISNTTRQFRVPLDTLRERSGDEKSIPVVIRKAVEYLEADGLEVVGIFRRAPNNTKVHAIKRSFDEGKEVDLFEYGDPHVAAVLIKLFLRDLPEPLLTFQAYSKIVGIRSQKEAESRLSTCREVIHNLPPANYDLLKYLINFICKVRAHEEVNKMTSLNLAIVFGPNLIWSTEEAASLMGLGEINSFTLMMIDNFDTIFTK